MDKNMCEMDNYWGICSIDTPPPSLRNSPLHISSFSLFVARPLSIAKVVDFDYYY